MPSPYVISISNGSGSGNILNGNYNVTGSSPGYTTTIDPSSVTIVNGTTQYAFTLTADGTLDVHVSEDGTTTGTAVAGAQFYRCNQAGTQTYGSVVTSDSNGIAEFDYLPHADTGSPTVYYKQTATSGDHYFDNSVQSIVLTLATTTIQVTNTLAQLSTILLTDDNYSGLPLGTGTVTLTLA